MLWSIDYYADHLFTIKNSELLAQISQTTTIDDVGPATLNIGEEKILNNFRADRDYPAPPNFITYSLPPNPELFVGEPDVYNVTLSPSGRYIGLVKEENGKKYAVIYDLDGEEKTRALNFNETNIDWIAWANDDRLLVGYSSHLIILFLDLEIHIGGSRVLAINRDGSESIILFDGEPAVSANNFDLAAVTHLLPDDPSNILMSAFDGNRLGVWRVNVNTGDAEQIQKGTVNTGAWFADARGQPVVRIDTNRRATFLKLFTKSPKTGEWRKVSSGPYTPNRAPNVWPVASTDTAGVIYVLAHAENEDRVSMKVFDANSGEFLSTAFAHPDVDLGGAMVDTGSNTYLGAWYVEDQYGVNFQDSTLQAHYNGLRKFFDNNANVYIRNSSRASDQFLVYVAGPQDPGDYYTYDYGKQVITPLFSARPYLPREQLGTMEIIQYSSRDGQELTAYLTHPNGDQHTPAPLIVMPHGGPEVRDSFTFDGYAQFLASRGYRVLQPNFRGSAGYGKTFAEAGYGEWGEKMQDDVTDAVQHVISKGIVQDDKVCIFGASYGGYAALVGALKSPDLYRCAVSVSGVSNLLLFLKSERKQDGANSQSYRYWMKAIGHPHSDRQFLEANSPHLHAAEISVPIMLVHGADDQVVPVAQSQIMRDALRENGKDVRYIEFPKTGHSRWDTEKEVALLNSLERFFAKHLGDENPATVAYLSPPEEDMLAP